MPSKSATNPAADNSPISAEQAEAFLEARRLGDRIKFLRQRKSMGLVELGAYTGLSASFLSQLETGRVVPTLRNLARIALVFSRDLSYFFAPAKTELFRILRAADRQHFPQSGVDDPGYFYESLGLVPAPPSIASTGAPTQRIAPYVAEFLPATETRSPRAHSHDGNEFLYVLTGRLQLTHDALIETLDAGDAVYFDASATHSYAGLGDTPCTALILTLPEPNHAPPPATRLHAPKSATAANRA